MVILLTGLMFQDNRYESLKQRSFKERRVFMILMNTQGIQEWDEFQQDLEKDIKDKGLDEQVNIFNENCESMKDYCEFNDLTQETQQLIFQTPTKEIVLVAQDKEKVRQFVAYEFSDLLSEQFQNKTQAQNSSFIGIKAFDMTMIGLVKSLLKDLRFQFIHFDKIEEKFYVVENQSISRSEKLRNEQVLVYIQLNGLRQVITYDENFWQEEITNLNYFFLSQVYDINLDNYLEYYGFKAEQRVFLLYKKNQCQKLREQFQQTYDKVRNLELDKKIIFVSFDMSQQGQNKALVEHMVQELFGESERIDQNCYVLGVDYEKKTRGSYLIYNSLQEDEKVLEEQALTFAQESTKIQIYYKSELVPKEEFYQETQVKKIVSKNFELEVLNNTQDFFLVIIENDSKEGQIIISFMDILQRKIPKVKFGFLLGSKNDIKQVKTHMYPSFIYFKSSNKNVPQIYRQSFHYDLIVDFVSKLSRSTVKYDQEFQTEFFSKVKQIEQSHKDYQQEGLDSKTKEEL